MNLIKYFFFILLLFYSSCYISLPFKRDFNKEALNKHNIYNELSSNILSTTLYIGSPIQELKFQIVSRKDFVYVLERSLNLTQYKLYNMNTSKSSRQFCIDFESDLEDFTNSYYTEDHLEYKGFTSTKNFGNPAFSFLAAYNVNEKELSLKPGYTGRIGLSPDVNFNYKIIQNINIVSSFKQSKIIDSYDFYFNYTSNDEGQLIIGALPFEVDNKKYSNNNFALYMTQTIPIEGKSELFWSIVINNITYGESLNNFYLKTSSFLIFKFEQEIFISGSSFKMFLKKMFFDNKNCNEVVKNKYTFFECDKSVDISQFDSINIYSYEIKGYFSFDHNDLFYEFDDKYIFMIKFDNEIDDDYLIVGQMFLRKHLVAFNHDKKIIYISNKNVINFKDIKKSDYKLIVIFIFVGLLIISFIAIGYIYRLYKISKKKKEARELIDDNYEYKAMEPK